MKFVSLAAAVLAFALPAFAQVTGSLTYDTQFDDPSTSLAPGGACNWSNGPTIQGCTILGCLPTFPDVGAVYTATGWNSPVCGPCFEVTSGSMTIPILAVDIVVGVAPTDGFVVSEEAMNVLTGGLGVELGRIEATWTEVDLSVCGL